MTPASERASAIGTRGRWRWPGRVLAFRDQEHSVSTYFAVYAIAVLIAVLVAIGSLEYRLAASERRAIEQDAARTARTIAAGIDRRITVSENLLTVLAGSHLLLNADLEAFYRQAAEVARQLDNRIILRDATNNKVVLNTAFPWGTRLPDGGASLKDERELALRSGMPVVSDVFFGSYVDRYFVAVTIPVFRNGALIYYLSIAYALDGNEFTAILDRQRIGVDQVAAVIDRKGKVIARSEKNGEFIGKTAQAGYFAHALESAGVASGHNFEGVEVTNFHDRSALAGWRVAVSVPQKSLVAPWSRAINSFAIAFGGLLIVGGAIAYAIGSRITRAIGVLQSAALALGQHENVTPPITALRETNEIANAISLASTELRRSDENYSMALGAAEMGTWKWNVASGAFSASDRAKMIFGVPASTRYRRSTFISRIHPADLGAVDQAMRSCLARKGPYDVEYRLVDPSTQSIRWISSKGRAEFDEAGDPLFVHGVFQDITARKNAESERGELRLRLMRAQDEERMRLAHELHDQTGQSLTAVMLELKAVEAEVEPGGRDRLRRLRQELDRMGRTLHRVAWELRPAAIDDLGVTAALANYTSEWSLRSGIEVDLHRTDRSLCGAPDEVRTTVFRVVQEALTNVVKHAAGATAVSIVIDRTDALLQLTIEDNGQGFDPAAIETGALRGLGLAGMRERLSLIQGELAIESSAGVGTSIFVRIKLPGSKVIA